MLQWHAIRVDPLRPSFFVPGWCSLLPRPAHLLSKTNTIGT